MAIEIYFSQPIDDQQRCENELTSLKTILDHPDSGFFHLMDDEEQIVKSKELYHRHKDRVKTFIHVGMGGSSIGAQMLVNSLGNQKNVRFFFLNNIDPDYINECLESLNIEESFFYFVSRSGTTAETLSIFALITNWLYSQNYENKDLKNFMAFSTDPFRSELLSLAREWEIPIVPIPSAVGGRFSVLSTAGLVPALFADVDIEKLYQGAKILKSDIFFGDMKSNIVLQMARFLLKHKSLGKNQTVFIPYSSHFKELSIWFTQLWAESLGKKRKSGDDIVREGMTPLAGHGPADQHSLLQLLIDGPDDKVVIFLEIQNFENDFGLENQFDTSSLHKISPFTLGQLIKAELVGTIKLLENEKKPWVKMIITRRDEMNMGAIILYLQCLTVYIGHCLKINPFDQPAIEQGKKYSFEWLTSPLDRNFSDDRNNDDQ